VKSSDINILTLKRLHAPAAAMVLIAGCLITLIYLEGVRFIFGEPFQLSTLFLRAVFCTAVLAGSMLARIDYLENGQLRVPREALILLLSGVIMTILAIWLGYPLAALGAIATGYALLLSADYGLTQNLSRPRRWFIHLLFAGTAGAAATAAGQIATRFSDEEFYTILQVGVLTLLWLLLFLAFDAANQHKKKVVVRRGDLILMRFHLVLPLIAAAGIGLFLTINQYQNSFFSQKAPIYRGISQETPFMCGEIEPDDTSYDALEIHRRLIERVLANPIKQAPEYALLALSTEKNEYVEKFRQSLLEEAVAQKFSGPAHSIKYGQYEASMRIYFYIQIQTKYPDLFDEDESRVIQEWFAAINSRAMTVEWVDWLYALAFRFIPKGPYENQESGAGLLSLLEWQNLSNPILSRENRVYLDNNIRGWETGFRNSDDAITYQEEWIYNAYFQSLYTGEINESNLQYSFDWLLLQAPPGGQSLGYNHVGSIHFAVPAYLGHQLTGREDLLWLAGRSVKYLEDNDIFLAAKPGLEMPPKGGAASPTNGSCLMFGESGVPNRKGPLAPDKIVFRDGWSYESNYLLLNLRFTGWHRYKASNALIAAFHDDRVVKEQYYGSTLSWLPEGRSLFRDKRIPRENLNGLLVETTGISAALHQITSIGGMWAQDPPYYARVEYINTEPGLDKSITWIEGWHGWDQKREIHFYHHGPTIIIDHAKGPLTKQAAVTWHLPNGTLQPEKDRITLPGEKAEIMLLPLLPGEVSTEQTADSLSVQFTQIMDGELGLATIILTGDWYGAQVDLIEIAGTSYLSLVNLKHSIQIPVDGINGR
jgi:hypothetical protein